MSKMINFLRKHRAKLIANAAYEIVSPGFYVKSPVIRYRIDYDSNGYIYIYIFNGYKIKITLGDELNGDRMTVLEAQRIEMSALEPSDYLITSYHGGDWDKVIFGTHRDVRTTRKEFENKKFVPLEYWQPAQKFQVVSGGEEDE